MAVEMASNVFAGDRIRLDGEGGRPVLEVTSTEHAPGESVICVTQTDGSRYQRLVLLPDDPVMVVEYGAG